MQRCYLTDINWYLPLISVCCFFFYFICGSLPCVVCFCFHKWVNLFEPLAGHLECLYPFFGWKLLFLEHNRCTVYVQSLVDELIITEAWISENSMEWYLSCQNKAVCQKVARFCKKKQTNKKQTNKQKLAQKEIHYMLFNTKAFNYEVI